VLVSGCGSSGRRLAALGAIAAVACFPLAASAEADTRYAAPDGTGPAAVCSQPDPCSLDDAVEAPAVAAGDRVVLATGVYLLSDELDVDDAISVGGAPSAVPTVIATTPGEAAIAVDATDAELHDVTLIQLTGFPAVDLSRGLVDRVTAESDGAAACRLGVTGAGQSLIRDSVCWSGPSSVGAAAVSISRAGAGTRAGVLRNVTAWAAGSGGVAIDASASGGGTVSLDAMNVIASGVAADVGTSAAAASTSLVSLSASNFEQVVSSGAGTNAVTPPNAAANQTEEPLLVDPPNGEFDQQAGSPTIDAGAEGTFLGDRDLGGEARIQGPAPDIGADERDGTAPQTTIESGPAAAVRTSKVTFTFRASEPGSTFECWVDDADPVRCTSPYTTDSLNQGDRVFRVRATDPAGNVEATPAERFFNIDKVIDGANVAARGVQRQRGKRVAIAVSVRSGEVARVRAGGTLKVGNRRFRVESGQRTLIAGGGLMLRLEPQGKRASRSILKRLRRGEAGEASLSATFVDILGNRATSGDVEVRVKTGRGK